MYLHRSRVQGERFDVNPHKLIHLKFLEDSCQHAIFCPAVHARVDGMPAAKTLGEAAPLAAMLGDIQDRVEHLQIRQLHVSTLHWQALFDVRVLLLSEFHLENILFTECFNSVNTP